MEYKSVSREMTGKQNQMYQWGQEIKKCKVGLLNLEIRSPLWDHQGHLYEIEWREYKPDSKGIVSREMKTEISFQEAKI